VPRSPKPGAVGLRARRQPNTRAASGDTAAASRARVLDAVEPGARAILPGLRRDPA